MDCPNIIHMFGSKAATRRAIKAKSPLTLPGDSSTLTACAEIWPRRSSWRTRRCFGARRCPSPTRICSDGRCFLFLLTVQGLGAFALITLGVILTKSGVAKNVIRPRIRQEIARAGVALLPMFFFVALALGFLRAISPSSPTATTSRPKRSIRSARRRSIPSCASLAACGR